MLAEEGRHRMRGRHSGCSTYWASPTAGRGCQRGQGPACCLRRAALVQATALWRRGAAACAGGGLPAAGACTLDARPGRGFAAAWVGKEVSYPDLQLRFRSRLKLSLAHCGLRGRLEGSESYCFVTVLYSDSFLRSLDLNPRALPPQSGVDGMAGGIPEHSLDMLSGCVVRVAAGEGRHSRGASGG